MAVKGSIARSGWPHPDGGSRVVEMWDPRLMASHGFDGNVKPNLRPEIVPTRTYYPLHSAFAS